MTDQPDDTRRERVVVIGSGFGGLFSTQALRRAEVDVTIEQAADAVEAILTDGIQAAMAEHNQRG